MWMDTQVSQNHADGIDMLFVSIEAISEPGIFCFNGKLTVLTELGIFKTEFFTEFAI